MLPAWEPGVNRGGSRRVAGVGESGHWQGRRLHFVGIGGVGMSGLAIVAHTLGAAVTGSDQGERRWLDGLRERGIDTALGHAAENVPDGAEVVYSSAVPADNPERERARELGQAEIRRGELLGELSRLRPCIAVGGTHGKTTTAAMIVHVLRAAGARPGYVIGGELRTTHANADWGDGQWLVLEADESDRTFLALDPDVAVVTNVELDHQREFGSLRDVEEAFRAFLALAPEAVVWDRTELLALREGPVAPFDAPDPALDRAGSRFVWRGLEVRLRVPGEHNARNGAAALEACRLVGVDPERAAVALARFEGTGRRFEPIGTTSAGARVYDDYAHHPTAVRATLEAARTLEPARLVAVFQPHGYHRVKAMAEPFAEALACADLAVVVEVYSGRARSAEEAGVSAETIASAAAGAANGTTVLWIPDLGAAERYLRTELRAGDLCVTLGSGDVDSLARQLVA
jgi:UDP-N-acetylmuramate--alanine ligase